MIQLLDGPAAGRKISGLRAPVYLRVVKARGSSVFDVLDLLTDDPREDEEVFVYRQVSGHQFGGRVNIGGQCYDGIGDGEYRHMPRVNGDKLRTRAAWRAWVEARKT
jgi:hypothetical protein